MLQDYYCSLGQKLPRAGMLSSLWQKLMFRYTESSRAYHNLNHLRHMFKTLDNQPISPSIGWAIFYHDAIYVPGSSSNEHESALLAEHDLCFLGEKKDIIHQTSIMILKTQSHQFPESYEEKLLLDSDFAILGSSPEDYQQYCLNIRREFKALTDVEFYKARLRFLENLSVRETLYYTQDFKFRFEEQALRNVNQEMGMIQENLKLLQMSEKL